MRLFQATFESPAPIPNVEGKVVDGVGTALRLLGEEVRASGQMEDFKLEARVEPGRDMVTFTVNVDPTTSYPMSKVHAMASQIHYCLAALVSESKVRFSVKTTVFERQLEAFMRAIPQDESFYEPVGIWEIGTNRRVILDIADWLRTIGPIYEDCFVTLERYTNADELYNAITIESQSMKSALSRDNTNVVVLSQQEKAVVTKFKLESVVSPESNGVIFPCKVQGEHGEQNLHVFPFVDIHEAGLTFNHFVILPDYKSVITSFRNPRSRVFAVVPSFLKYPGYVTESFITRRTHHGMKCGIDPGKMYQMSFMFSCGLSKRVTTPVGKTCVPDNTMYKTKRFHQQLCKFPTEEGVDEDSGCCVSSTSPSSFLKEAMVMYARKTRDHNKKYSYLSDIYEWYRVSVGPILAYDTSISVIYPPEKDGDISEYNAFAHMQPVVKHLQILYPDSLEVSTFVDWYREVNSVFRIRERYDVSVFFTMEEDARYIDNEYIIWVIQNTRPKRKLIFELPSALFVDNDPGPICNAMYDTENFQIKFDINSDERMFDPTNMIGRAGFHEVEDAQNLFQDEDNPDNFRHFRLFERDHVDVTMTLTLDRLQLEVSTSHAFV